MTSNPSNPLPGVPLVESPFFEELLGGGRLDAETWRIANDLRNNGFAVFDFPEPDFLAVAERIRTKLSPRVNFDDWRQGGGTLRVQDAWKTDEDVRRISANEAVRKLLSTIYGREAFPFQSITFPVGTEQHAHTDSVHFSSMPERFMCGVWVALEDVGLEQGPLLYYPGSHKWPIYTNEHIGHVHMRQGATSQYDYEGFWDRLVAAHGVKPVRFTPKAGQALIWAANLLHGGDWHWDRTKTRWSQVTHYLFDDCCYYTPMMSDEPFGSIFFREPYNIITGETVKNHYQGKPVPDSYIASTQPTQVMPLWGTSDAASLPADFDPAAYLEANPDVALSGANAAEHYLAFGIKEGRRLRVEPGEGVLALRGSTSGTEPLPADFDPAAYLEANPDVALAGVDPIRHYKRFGIKERRPLRVELKGS
jgi:hypothetical protein